MEDDIVRVLNALAGLLTDVEERARAEEATRTRELTFRLIVDSIPAPVAVTSPSGEVEALNRVSPISTVDDLHHSTFA
jgi:PAS domain-containing protein